MKLYCGRCDGVGWYEGGTALQTGCEECDGTGYVFCTPNEDDYADENDYTDPREITESHA